MNNKLRILVEKHPELIKFIQYALVGVIGTLVHTVVLTISVELFKMAPIYSTMLGFIFSLVISYKLNSIWTFSTTVSIDVFFKYVATCLIGLLVNVLIMFVTVNMLNLYYLYGQLIAIAVVPVFNFTVSRLWVFKK
ncbi:GtrA family protein [Paenibacillus sp. JNUCC32]|uniref:GtrA family protein n=1 Tax=Paenibacillus sp. JNUCC32 TaxID=2777984 RepID=UPI00178878A7|nr:GtrA family protein [Paenibacillus sp. JNUCC-32]